MYFLFFLGEGGRILYEVVTDGISATFKCTAVGKLLLSLNTFLHVTLKSNPSDKCNDFVSLVLTDKKKNWTKDKWTDDNRMDYIEMMNAENTKKKKK